MKYTTVVNGARRHGYVRVEASSDDSVTLAFTTISVGKDVPETVRYECDADTAARIGNAMLAGLYMLRAVNGDDDNGDDE